MTSFIAGLDVIDVLLGDCDSLPSNAMKDDKFRNSLRSVLWDLRCSTRFLAKIINRCADYTQMASSSIVQKHHPHDSANVTVPPLLPIHSDRIRSVNLTKAVEEVVAVMNTVSTTSSVTISSTFEGIVNVDSHDIMIETDKEWLDDNLLCLLSNGVKYASHHAVMTVSFVIMARRETSHCDNHDFNSCSRGMQLVEMVRIAVTDDGPGIPSAAFEAKDSLGRNVGLNFDWDHLTSQQDRHCGGLGLGMYCLARRIEALGGYYGIANSTSDSDVSASGSTTIWFALPCPSLVSKLSSRVSNTSLVSLNAQSQSQAMGSPISVMLSVRGYEENANEGKSPTIVSLDERTSSGTLSGSAPSCLFAGLNILLVDDSPAILKMTALLLSKLHPDNKIVTAKHGLDALNLMLPSSSPSDSRHNSDESMLIVSTDLTCAGYPKFHVVLMDLQMPILDGYDAIARVRQWESLQPCGTSTALIIAMSANADPETKVKALEVGANDFLTKPFTMQSLRNILQQHNHVL